LGKCWSNWVNASSPPADAPMPTIGKDSLGETGRRRRVSDPAATGFGLPVGRAAGALLPRSPNCTATPSPFFRKPRKCLTLKRYLFARTWRPWLAVFVRENGFDMSRLAEVFRKHAVSRGSWVRIDRHEKSDQRSSSLPDLDCNDGTVIMSAWFHSTSQALTTQQFPPTYPNPQFHLLKPRQAVKKLVRGERALVLTEILASRLQFRRRRCCGASV
jgi:hypothetical protein